MIGLREFIPVLGIVLFLVTVCFAGSLRQVEQVIDGDTVVLDGQESVRLIGIDTPETVHPNKPVQCYGAEASDYLKNRLEDKSVRLEYDAERIDKYGRTLGYIYLDKAFINAEMVINGYAFTYKRFPFKYLKKFTRYENKAKKKKIGLWSSCSITCEDTKCETGYVQ